ncbi:arylsulfatase [Fulvivirgaceae bacterium BMA10]|uniref:Arylsulfatase n=1 Tax=Splendidivirga corallicola TaxID=3051826 RepID=A0ABT8KXZ1_9BACT|nr:arylsulfatase [Fulvivirgaceae bacterium BMA10]
MKGHYLIFFLVILFSCQTKENKTQSTASENRPNVILIMTDDQGYGDLGFHGNPHIKTPVLDSLARTSTRFTSFYVSPVCAPTRSSLMTGRHSLRTGIRDTYNGGAIMADSEVTIAEILKENGYRTGMFGKWHLGDNYPFRPEDQGFDETVWHASGGIGQVGDVKNYYAFDSSYFDPELIRNGVFFKSKGYCSDVYTDEALHFIDQENDDPFFIYLSFNAPHTPLQLPKSSYEMYQDVQVDAGSHMQKGYPVREMSDRDIDAARKVYGMVSNIDDNLGRLFNHLNKKGLAENTIVIFLTDNGPQQNRYNGGLRGRKGMVYEGGVKVPFFISYGNKIPKDQNVDIPGAHIDVLPTLLSLCDIESTNISNPIDGKDLKPLIYGESVTWADRPLFFHWQRGFPEPYRNVAVRKGDYKLVGNTAHHANVEDFELFNLAEDPYESVNLNLQLPDKVNELRSLFDDWYNNVIKEDNLVAFPRIPVGTEHENPVLLNRNDAKGAKGIWNQDLIYGYWDVSVEETGSYDVRCYFRENVKNSGRLKVRLGSIQRSKDHADTLTRLVEIENIELQKGNYQLETWFREHKKWQNVHFPFYVEIEKK